MTYNLCYFLGNKAFVIDFLETGVTLLCVFAAYRERIVRGEQISPTRIPTGLLFKFVWYVCCYLSTTCYSTHFRGLFKFSPVAK